MGTHTVRVRATDAACATTTSVFELTVVNKNDAPFFVSAPLDATVAEGEAFVAAVLADDVDLGDTLLYSLVGAPAQMSIGATDGQLLFTPDDAEVGTHNLTVRVEDDGGVVVQQSAPSWSRR